MTATGVPARRCAGTPAAQLNVTSLSMNSLLPRLRDDAVIRKFDGDRRTSHFIVAVDGRHFLVSERVAVLLEMLRENLAATTVAGRMTRQFGQAFDAKELESALRFRVPAVFFRREAAPGIVAPLSAQLRLFEAATLAPVLQSLAALFAPSAVIALLGAFLIADAMVGTAIWRQGLGVASSCSFAGAVALIVAGVAIHELGHLSACRRYGASHGGIGAGLYWCMPVFYAEVHGAWLLSRRERAVVDIAGVYFQCVYLLVLDIVWLAQASGTVFVALWTTHFLILNTLNPVLKYDGYWLLCDLSGRHNLHAQIRAIARQSVGALLRRRSCAPPPVRDAALLGAFVALATAYFAYLLYFMAHNLAFAASNLSGEHSAWQFALAAAGLALLTIAAAGVSLLLARAVRSIADHVPR
jgi:putative peptide zinc metalloprotease protein